MGEIFTSHASAGAVRGAQIAGAIRRACRSIFLGSDEHDGTVPGEDRRRALLRQLRLFGVVVYLNSKVTRTSQWCHAELVVTADLGRRIHPLSLESGIPLHLILDFLQDLRLDGTLESSVRRRLADIVSRHGLAGSIRLRWDLSRRPSLSHAAIEKADTGVSFAYEGKIRELLEQGCCAAQAAQRDTVVIMSSSGAGKASLAAWVAPTAKMCAAGDARRHIVLWNISPGRRIATLAEGKRVLSVAFTPNGRLLAAGDIAGNAGLLSGLRLVP